MIINSADITPDDWEGWHKEQRLWVYNALDNCVTREIWDKISPELNPETTGLVYNFGKHLVGPAVTIMRRGLRVDLDYRDALVDKWTPEVTRVGGMARVRKGRNWKWEIVDEEAPLQVLARTIWGGVFNYHSDPQMKKMFYKVLKVPTQYKFEKGQKKVSTDREALENISALYPRAAPLAALVLHLKDLEKKLSVLNSGVSEDGRMRFSYNICGTETGRWCVSGEHEVLTPGGWKFISQWQESDEIVQWHPYKGLTWCQAQKHTFEYDGELITIETDKISGRFTPEHRLVFLNSHGKVRTEQAKNEPYQRGAILGDKLSGVFEDENKTRILVMVQADGSFLEGGALRFGFRKQRKIDRCEELLNSVGIKYQKFERSGDAVRIYVNSKNIPDWLWGRKHFDARILRHDPNVFCNEALLWDGHKKEKTFYTTNLEDAEWVKTMGHLAGYYTSLKPKHTKWNTCYRVRFNTSALGRVSKNDYSKDISDGKVFCPETDTGFFLIRHRGKIYVTGNSSRKNIYGTGTNGQNITEELRRIFIPDDGMVFLSPDLEQAESRAVAYIAEDENYIAACEGGDLHTTVAKMVWPDMPWTGDLKTDKELAETPYYRDYSYRFMCKKASHGSNYGGTARTLARQMKVEEKLVTRFQLDYLGGEVDKKKLVRWGFRDLIDRADRREGDMLFYEGAFGGIKHWHHEIEDVLQTQRPPVLITPLGRARQFWGRKNDAATLREAIAYLPQSTVADVTNLGLFKIWVEFDPDDAQVLGQTHDSVLIQVDEDRVDEMKEKITDRLTFPVPVNGREMVIPVDMKAGKNAAKADPKCEMFEDGNPEGVK